MDVLIVILLIIVGRVGTVILIEGAASSITMQRWEREKNKKNKIK